MQIQNTLQRRCICQSALFLFALIVLLGEVKWTNVVIDVKNHSTLSNEPGQTLRTLVFSDSVCPEADSCTSTTRLSGELEIMPEAFRLTNTTTFETTTEMLFIHLINYLLVFNPKIY